MIVVTGATGFVGRYVVLQLLAQGRPVRIFARNPEKARALFGPAVEVAVGDLADEGALQQACTGAQAVVNIASLGFGHGPGIVRALVAAGVERAVFVSTTAIFTHLNAKTKTFRLAAEEAIMASPLRYAILRPTMIYGDAGDRNIARLLRVLRRTPIMPVLGQGKHLQQPVHVTDVAGATLSVLAHPVTERKAYNIVGAAPLTFNALISQSAAALGRKVGLVHLPLGLVIPPLRLIERLVPRPPLKVEQVLRLEEDKAFPYTEAATDFGYQPLPFALGVQMQVADMRQQGLL